MTDSSEIRPSRVHGPQETPAGAGHNHAGYERTCKECGGPHTALTVAGEFCSNLCRHRFNNRRKSRGAELYDLFMTHRYDRPLAKLLGLLSLMNNLARIWRDEDETERQGRESWQNARQALARRPYIRAKVVNHNAAGGRRR